MQLFSGLFSARDPFHWVTSAPRASRRGATVIVMVMVQVVVMAWNQEARASIPDPIGHRFVREVDGIVTGDDTVVRCRRPSAVRSLPYHSLASLWCRPGRKHQARRPDHRPPDRRTHRLSPRCSSSAATSRGPPRGLIATGTSASAPTCESDRRRRCMLDGLLVHHDKSLCLLVHATAPSVACVWVDVPEDTFSVLQMVLSERGARCRHARRRRSP